MVVRLLEYSVEGCFEGQWRWDGLLGAPNPTMQLEEKIRDAWVNYVVLDGRVVDRIAGNNTADHKSTVGCTSNRNSATNTFPAHNNSVHFDRLAVRWAAYFGRLDSTFEAISEVEKRVLNSFWLMNVQRR